MMLRFVRVLFVMIFCFSFVACTTAQKLPAMKPDPAYEEKKVFEKMVGRWLGERETDEGGMQWLMDRRKDGTFTIRFRMFNKNKGIHEQTEAGIWGASGPVYFTATREIVDSRTKKFEAIDTTDPSYYDAYKIIEVTDEIFRYQNLTNGTIYNLKRVDPGFNF